MRHPGLAVLWVLCLGVTLLSLAAPMLLIIPFAPVLSIITADAVAYRGAAESQRPAWRVIYGVVMALLVAVSAAGIVVLVVAPLELRFMAATPAMALVFLASIILGVRALAVRSPRRAAIPACVAHVPTAMVLLQALTMGRGAPTFGPGIVPWGGVLVLSALASMLSIVGFDGRPAGVVPAAKVRS